MLLRNKGTKEQYHVPSGIGKAMIHAGLAEEVIPVVAARTPSTTWKALQGPVLGDYQYPPVIYFSCSSCGNRGSFEGPTAHETQVFRHCHDAEKTPKAVAAQYVALLKGTEGSRADAMQMVRYRIIQLKNGQPKHDARRLLLSF